MITPVPIPNSIKNDSIILLFLYSSQLIGGEDGNGGDGGDGEVTKSKGNICNLQDKYLTHNLVLFILIIF